MLIHLLGVKIQQLIVTESSESYSGSVSLPHELLQASGLNFLSRYM